MYLYCIRGSANLQISSLGGCFKKINAFLVYAIKCCEFVSCSATSRPEKVALLA